MYHRSSTCSFMLVPTKWPGCTWAPGPWNDADLTSGFPAESLQHGSWLTGAICSGDIWITSPIVAVTLRKANIAVENPPFIDVPVKTSKPRSGISPRVMTPEGFFITLKPYEKTRDWLVKNPSTSVLGHESLGPGWLDITSMWLASAFQVASPSSTSGEAYPSQQHQQASEDAAVLEVELQLVWSMFATQQTIGILMAICSLCPASTWRVLANARGTFFGSLPPEKKNLLLKSNVSGL